MRRIALPVLDNEDPYIKSMYKPLYIMGGSPDDIGEVLVTQVKLRKSRRVSCDVGETRKGLGMSCDVGEATKGSLQHEISHIGTFILVMNYFLYQNKILFSIWFFHGVMRRTGGQSGTVCVSLPHTVAMLIFQCPNQSIQENTALLNIEIYKNVCLIQWFNYTNCKIK